MTNSQDNGTKIPVYNCQKDGCGHSWYPRSTERPRICPKCKSVNWDRPQGVSTNPQKEGGKEDE